MEINSGPVKSLPPYVDRIRSIVPGTGMVYL